MTQADQRRWDVLREKARNLIVDDFFRFTANQERVEQYSFETLIKKWNPRSLAHAWREKQCRTLKLAEKLAEALNREGL